MVMLTGSLIISWIFAKSITNAANLGLEFGLVGGVAYAGYYLILCGGWNYNLPIKNRGGYTSIHHFLTDKYGRRAVGLFSILISFRLFNEVWSNTMVIGTYFGEMGTTALLCCDNCVYINDTSIHLKRRIEQFHFYRCDTNGAFFRLTHHHFRSHFCEPDLQTLVR